MGVASIAGSNRLRWNRVSIAKPLVIGWKESLLAFSGRDFPLGSIPFPLPGTLAFEPLGFRALRSCYASTTARLVRSHYQCPQQDSVADPQHGSTYGQARG